MKKILSFNKPLIILFAIIQCYTSCTQPELELELDLNQCSGACESSFGTFVDPRDSNEYKTIKIGSQIWMAENLAYLPSISDKTVYSDTFSCYYVYKCEAKNVNEAKTTDYYKAFGVLYNWKAAQEAPPPGWHLPSDQDWNTLVDYL